MAIVAAEIAPAADSEIHRRFVDFVADDNFKAAADLTGDERADGSGDPGKDSVLRKAHFARYLEVVIRDLGPIRQYRQVPKMPDDAYFVGIEDDDYPSDASNERYFEVEYSYFGSGFMVTSVVEGSVRKFGFCLPQGPRASQMVPQLMRSLANLHEDEQR